LSVAGKTDTVILSCEVILTRDRKYMKQKKTACSAIEMQKKRISVVFKNVTIVYYRLGVKSQIDDAIYQ
jgi:hypothetical protein